MNPRQIALLGFCLSAIGFICSNLHFEGVIPVYVSGAYLQPQPHHVVSTVLLASGALFSIIAIRHGIVFTPGIALLLSGSILAHVLNLHY